MALTRIESDDEILNARSVTGLSDGMEVAFSVNYLRPARGTLELQATYFDEVEQMRPGWFVAYDKDGKQMFCTRLSKKENAAAQFELPPLKAQSSRDVLMSGNAPDARVTAAQLSTERRVSSQSAKSRLPYLIGLCLAVIAVGIGFAALKFANRNSKTAV